MPITFACPQCKSEIKVDDKLAGKSGKCKCGATITIPAPGTTALAKTGASKPGVARPGVSRSSGPPTTSGPQKLQPARPQPAQAPRTGGLAAVFDQLTEADYNQQSPYQNVYSPPKSTVNHSAALQRFDDGRGQQPKAAGQLSGLLILISVINFIQSLGAMCLAVLFLLATAMVDQIAEKVPMARVGLGLAVAIFAITAIVLLSGGIGLLMKKQWGWFLVAMTYAFSIIYRIADVGLSFAFATQMGAFQMGALVGTLVGLLATVALGAGLCSADTRKIYQIKTLTLPIIAGVLGVVLGLALIGTIAVMGVYSASQNVASGAGNS